MMASPSAVSETRFWDKRRCVEQRSSEAVEQRSSGAADQQI